VDQSSRSPAYVLLKRATTERESGDQNSQNLELPLCTVWQSWDR